MTNKDLLIKILEKISNIRDLAEGFLFIIKKTDNSELLDELRTLISTGIRSITDEHKKNVIKIQLQEIKKLKDKEQKSINQDQNDANNILNTLLNELE